MAIAGQGIPEPLRVRVRADEHEERLGRNLSCSAVDRLRSVSRWSDRVPAPATTSVPSLTWTLPRPADLLDEVVGHVLLQAVAADHKAHPPRVLRQVNDGLSRGVAAADHPRVVALQHAVSCRRVEDTRAHEALDARSVRRRYRAPLATSTHLAVICVPPSR